MDTAACCPFLRSWSAERRQRQAAGSCRFSAIPSVLATMVASGSRCDAPAMHFTTGIRLTSTLALLAYAVTVAPASALATNRYVGVGGSTTDPSCTDPAHPCDLEHAVTAVGGGGRRRHGTARPLRRPVFAVGRPSDDDPRAGRRAASDARSRRLERRTERRPARAPLPRSRPFQCAHVLRTRCRRAADRGRRQRNLHALRHARVP